MSSILTGSTGRRRRRKGGGNEGVPRAPTATVTHSGFLHISADHIQRCLTVQCAGSISASICVLQTPSLVNQLNDVLVEYFDGG